MPELSRPRLRAGLLVAALIVTSGLTTACDPLAPAGGPSQQTIKALDTMRFEPPSITVPAGQPVQLTLANDGALIHDLVLQDGADRPFTIEANGKSSASGTVTVLRPGTYTYVCAQPGHEAAGMKGTIVAR